MSRRPEAFVRPLSGEEGQRLVRVVHTSRDRVVRRRAMILLASAQGRSASDIAAMIGVSVDYVGEVVHAFNEHGFRTLDWARHGAGTLSHTNGDTAPASHEGLSQTNGDTAPTALAATPWPVPANWASRARERRPTAPRPRPASQLSDGPATEAAPQILQPPPGWSALRPTAAHGLRPGPVELSSRDRRRLYELERENARLREERDLLKAVTALLAAEGQLTLPRP